MEELKLSEIGDMIVGIIMLPILWPFLKKLWESMMEGPLGKLFGSGD